MDQAKINPYDIGLLRGYAVFDVMCTQKGKPFLIEAHWKRFLNSAKELNLKVPISKKVYIQLVEKLLKLNGYKKSTVRTILTGGVSDNGFSHKRGREVFYILIEKFCPIPEKIYTQGAGVITLEHDRFFPGAKITNYVVAVRNQDRKEKAGALEIIYIKDKKALEASTSNFFIVKNNKIITTKNNILLGTTRNLVVDIARKAGLNIVERDVKASELFFADEMFLTATNKDIVPVVRIDGKRIGSGKVGPATKRIMKLFSDFVEKY